MRKIDKNPHKKVASVKTEQQSTMMEQKEANGETSWWYEDKQETRSLKTYI